MVLLAGPSGSGKSRLVRLSGCPELALDDFYRDFGSDGVPTALPRVTGSHAEGANAVDWDHVASWDAGLALQAVAALCRDGWADVPTYDIATSARTGEHRLELGHHRGVVAEGVFAPEMVRLCRHAGLQVLPVYLDRPRLLTAVLRLLRDLREHRKPPLVLLRRGLALWRSEPAFRAHATAAGCRPMSMRMATEVLRATVSAAPEPQHLPAS